MNDHVPDIFEVGNQAIANAVKVNFPTIAYENLIKKGIIDEAVRETIEDRKQAWANAYLAY